MRLNYAANELYHSQINYYHLWLQGNKNECLEPCNAEPQPQLYIVGERQFMTDICAHTLGYACMHA